VPHEEDAAATVAAARTFLDEIASDVTLATSPE
jgi:hypothetical protein